MPFSTRDTIGKKYPRNPGARRVPDHLLKTILGDEKMPNPSKRKGARKEIQKRTSMTQGRQGPGAKRGPRGGRNMMQDLPTQLSGGVGTHPQEAPHTKIENDLIDKIMKGERNKKYDREDLLAKLAADEAEEKQFANSKKKPMNAGRKKYRGEAEEEEEE